MKSGQILILVLLVVVVALAVGLSVASRNIMNLRTSTQTEQSQRAFSAAEGGVEDVLSRLGDIATSNSAQVGSSTGYTFDVPVGDLLAGGITANVNVKSNKIYEFTLKPGEVGQVNLLKEDGNPFSGNITVEWIKSADENENTTDVGDDTASIELTYVCTSNGGVCDTEGASGYSQFREAYESTPISGGQQIGFSSTAPVGGSLSCAEGATYVCTLTRPVSNARLLRIKPFWRQATVKVSSGVADFPVQTYEVESVATTEIGVTRRVKVTRTALEQLPAAFDYVLFSEGDITK